MKIPKIKSCFQLGLLLMIIKVSFSASGIMIYSDLMDNVLSLLAVMCFVIYILKKRYSLQILLVYMLIAVISLYSSLRVENYELLITVMTCLAARKEDTDDTLKFVFKYETYFLIIHTICALFLSSIGYISLTTVISGVVRYHFGMGHPNRFSIYLFNLVLLWIFLNLKRITAQHIFWIFLINIISFYFTKTRTNLIMMIMILIILGIIITVKMDEDKLEIFKKIAMLIFPIMTIFTSLCVVMYMNGSKIAMIIDQLLSSRIRLGAYAFHNYGITLFGQDVLYDIEYNSTWKLNNFTFDNMYTFLISSQGCVWILIITFLLYRLAKYGDVRIHFAIIAWTLYGITEVHGLNCYMCFPILLTYLLLEKKRVKNYGLDLQKIA